MQRVDLSDLLKGLDLSRADSRAGLGALLREIGERPHDRPGDVAAAIGLESDTTVYNGKAGGGLEYG